WRSAATSAEGIRIVAYRRGEEKFYSSVSIISMSPSFMESPALNYRALVCLALIHALVDCFSQFVSPLWPSLQTELGVAPWAISLLFASWQMGASLSQPLFGYLGDRFDTRWIVGLGPGMAIACITLVGLAPGPITLGLLLAIGGLGIGGFHPEAAVGVVQ